MWKRANQLLKQEGRGGERRERNRHGEVLKNLPVCAASGNRKVPGTRTRTGTGVSIMFVGLRKRGDTVAGLDG